MSGIRLDFDIAGGGTFGIWARARDKIGELARFALEELGISPDAFQEGLGQVRFLVFDGKGVMVEEDLTVEELAPRDGEHLVLEVVA